jgi:predicted ester cyclase
VTDEARGIVQRYLDLVLVGRKPGITSELVADPGLRRSVAALRSAFPDLAISSVVMVSRGGMVGVHIAARATHRGIFQGVPPTGRTWAATCTAIYRVRDGHIVDSWENWDLLGILEQIGGVRRADSASA